MSPRVSRARTKPALFLLTKPNLMPLVVEFSPPVAAPPLIRPAAARPTASSVAGIVSSLAGVKPELAASSAPLPMVPRARPRLSTAE